MKKLKSSILSLLCSILVFSTVASYPGSTASAAERSFIDEDLIVEHGLEELLSVDSDFTKFMEGLEELPVEMEGQSPEQVAAWLTQETGVEVIADGENIIVPPLAEVSTSLESELMDGGPINPSGVIDCIIAVGIMIGTVGFPLSKILKLKKAISFLGGVSKIIKKVYKRYKELKSWKWRTKDAWKKAIEEQAKDLPSQIRDAFLDFFNIANVIRACT